MNKDFREKIEGWLSLLFAVVIIVLLLAGLGFLIQFFGLDFGSTGCGGRWVECDYDIPEGYYPGAHKF